MSNENRELKFRAWDKDLKKMSKPFGFESSVLNFEDTHFRSLNGFSMMQYTGFKLKGHELYEGDIIRIEEDSQDGKEDNIFYVVIQWIKEWGMFATLLVDEYKDYLDQGVKVLDVILYWTYTLEDSDDRKHFLAGNIYQNPDLLNVTPS